MTEADTTELETDTQVVDGADDDAAEGADQGDDLKSDWSPKARSPATTSKSCWTCWTSTATSTWTSKATARW